MIEHSSFTLLASIAGALLIMESLFILFSANKKKRITENLEAAKDEAKMMVSLCLNIPYPIIQMNERGEILFANIEALEIFPDLIAMQATHPAIKDIVLDNRADKDNENISIENKIYDRQIYILDQEENKIANIYFHDITALKTQQHALEDARDDADKHRQSAESANKARADFLANMSHELRTPMNGIIGLSDLLCTSEGIALEEKEMAKSVHHAAQNLLYVLNDILDFSKIEAGEIDLEKISFDLLQTVRHTCDIHSVTAENKGINLIYNKEKNNVLYVQGDPARIGQIMNNLIGNAIKFTEEGSVTIDIANRPIDKQHLAIDITVKDTGIGIAKDKQKNIFKKFQQADSSTSRKYGGTGLGLSITTNLLKMMGAKLSLESEPGIGSTFSFSLHLPIGKAEEADDVAHDKNTTQKVECKTPILIVDDHPVNLLYLRKRLQDFGATKIIESSSGYEAIKLCQKDFYPLIFMDCQMPEISGYEASEVIKTHYKSQNKNAKIIAVTADVMEGAVDRCLAHGMDGYLGKPIQKEKLWQYLKANFPLQKSDSELSKPNHNELTKRKADFIDWHYLNDFTDGDKKIENELFSVFLENLETDLEALRQMNDKDDFKKWLNYAHKIYGSSCHVGAKKLSVICDKAQSLSQDNVKQMKAMTHAIEKSANDLKEYIGQIG